VSGGVAKLIPLRRIGNAPSDLSDDALVAACAVGDRAALGALFDRHERALYRFLSRLATTDRDEIDDLVQNTFLEAWRSANRFRGRGDVRSWLFGIGCNVARRYVRGKSRRRSAHANLAESAPGRGPVKPDDEAERRQLMARLGDALARLPHSQREAFVLCDLEGMTGVAAARAVGVRQGTMWRRLHEARRALRDALEGRHS